jgi:primosomal protein N'
VAEQLSESYDVPLILGTWTPRTTTFYRALKGEFQVLQLLEKYK